MLRADKNAEVVILPWTVTRMFTGRYAVQSGRRIFAERWKRELIEAVRETQQQQPVAMV